MANDVSVGFTITLKKKSITNLYTGGSSGGCRHTRTRGFLRAKGVSLMTSMKKKVWLTEKSRGAEDPEQRM